MGPRVWHTCVMAHIWRTEDNLWKSVLSFHRMDSGTALYQLGGVMVRVFACLVGFLFVFVNLMHIRVTWKEGSSVEKIPQ